MKRSGVNSIALKLANAGVKEARERVKKERARFRSQRINNISRRLAARHERQRHKELEGGGSKKPFVRKDRPENPRFKQIIAYDFETTRIKKGTPKPLYLTAYGEKFHYSSAIRDIETLCDILIAQFLTEENKGCRFVAWNGNKYDAYFIAAALLHSEDYIIRPYMTRTKNLRGMKVISKQNEKHSWEFLDGMAMVGSVKPLKDFLKTFAPEYLKLDSPNWEKEEFNAKNPAHVAYAERDSEGLYHALHRAQDIVIDTFKTPLMPTIGNMGIKILQAHIPHGVQVYEPSYSSKLVIRDYVMRGGFCFCARKFEGPVWKYDINQAYAAAMRESFLPAGRVIHGRCYNKYATCAIYRISAHNEKNIVPFYYVAADKENKKLNGKSIFGVTEISNTWITSTEYDQLKREGWKIDIFESYYWETAFQLREYVDKLEQLRINAPGGPKSAQGEMMKAIGNNSYGKTVERLEGLELVLANDCPDGFHDYQCEDEEIQHIWFRFAKPLQRDYHQPQLGAFITAHVRMELRRAILMNPEGWLYADTDCAIFDSPADLPIDPARYGWWKIECEGENYRIITKKVYANFGATEKHSKGLNVGRLTDADFINWYNGEPPMQRQIQRQNFLKAMTGAEMFAERVKVGQRKVLDS